MVDYITYLDTIIFSPRFNKSINLDLLSSYNKIIFSNYELTDDLFLKYSNNNLKDLKYISSKFNQLLELPKNLIHITFGRNFNQPIQLPEILLILLLVEILINL